MIYPRIVHGATTIDASLSARPLRHGIPQGIGAGAEPNAPGTVISAWVTRWEIPLTVAQRITEAEWPAYRTWLMSAMQGNSFTWRVSPTGTAHTCFLVSPAIDAGGELPALAFPGDHEIVYTIRRVDGAAIDEVSF